MHVQFKGTVIYSAGVKRPASEALPESPDRKSKKGDKYNLFYECTLSTFTSQLMKAGFNAT